VNRGLAEYRSRRNEGTSSSDSNKFSHMVILEIGNLTNLSVTRQRRGNKHPP
jgi:hypothetical protein